MGFVSSPFGSSFGHFFDRFLEFSYDIGTIKGMRLFVMILPPNTEKRGQHMKDATFIVAAKVLKLG